MTLDSLMSWLRGPARPTAATASQAHLLHRRLEHARLAKMLRRMRVTPRTYVQRVHPDELREQLDNCASCAHRFRCDEALACQRGANVDLTFCPNHDTIRTASRAAQSRITVHPE